MFTQYDPNWTDSNAYDDRDEIEPEFEIEDDLAFGIGFETPDGFGY